MKGQFSLKKKIANKKIDFICVKLSLSAVNTLTLFGVFIYYFHLVGFFFFKIKLNKKYFTLLKFVCFLLSFSLNFMFCTLILVCPKLRSATVLSLLLCFIDHLIIQNMKRIISKEMARERRKEKKDFVHSLFA